jgi:L-threonate 2-dehydrogenase
MTTIAIHGMGEMGSAIAGRLIASGARVVTSLKDRSAATVLRAQAVDVQIVEESELLDDAELVLSIVPPAAAAVVASRALDLIKQSRRKPLFIDCNAIAPKTLHAISEPFIAEGLRFADGSIIGPSPKPGGPNPRLYLSGAVSAEARLLASRGLDARVLSDALGDASALKMAYAGFTKGFQAVATAMALGAARNGVAPNLVAELRDSQPALYAWLAKMLPGMYPKAYRWDDEMREIARFLEPEPGSVQMLTGAADLYRLVAAQYREGPQAEVISTLNRFSTPEV